MIRRARGFLNALATMVARNVNDVVASSIGDCGCSEDK
ncbi:hypothetical protein APY04_1725 [Hyphomicrobium sulfonivorans]|uniref:Uncharacterized protein n=1 Tax=Hyphomicrobium sulfonivorans TaxID=121290 RepID=A0A109BHN1_HYPSL|nr:hypothetical protein APY04_1725 [Hyphomicrobium sulfonivorans]